MRIPSSEYTVVALRAQLVWMTSDDALVSFECYTRRFSTRDTQSSRL